ncbi:E3 ubiquitin-protein ligase MARCHF6 [Nilaparvata lugens]|uniref:E3 ubiquitin-protein ligase MARCHF6 n=1 Tax=Nilaparvata lugens TaxID=108931 RepID=UPI00193E8BFC|nr:E3 ubiquitin-protein ligase MARCHF6 [Nilaparvata lugens]
MMEDLGSSDICRVCRSEGCSERPLFHPCICTGSIKWIHQECLVQWMRYSRKEYCELCGHCFSFTPIYSPDMPRRLPIRDVAGGLLASIATAVKYWLHFTLVALAWLGIVPLTACRIYRCLFTGSVDSILTLPLDMLSTDNIASDIFHGCFVVSCTLFAFIGLVWLREQILHGGGPDWLEREDPPAPPAPPPPLLQQPPHAQPLLDNNNEQPEQNEPIQELAVGGDDLPGGGADDGDDVGGAGGGAGGGALLGGEVGNWNAIEWDRAAEELTWERLLGLDGSLVFLEHVFWVVSLNTLFILVFAFCPYHMGHFALASLGLRDHAAASHFEGLVTTLCGYCAVGLCLLIFHSLASFFSFSRARRVLGLCYVVVKVSLLSVVEIGVLPLICGWWLDICSLSMFDATLRDREASFRAAPGTSMFIHWVCGMVYVYYFASFILLLREVLRPGVLWFLRNLNDPDFSPIQEMIHLPIMRHVRRLLASAVIFGTAVLLMLWLPVRVLRLVWPAFLPYTVALQTESTQVSELSLELLLLQVILPTLLEQSHTRLWLKATVRAWCRAVSHLLDLKSYLLGDDQPDPAQMEVGAGAGGANAAGVANDLGAAHQALLHRAGPTGFQPYQRPHLFAARIAGLLLLVAASLVAASLVALTVPVWLGRRVMTMWSVTPPGAALTSAPPPPPAPIHELYTASCGTYLCWLVARAAALVISWLPQGRAAFLQRLVTWAFVLAKAVVAFVVLFGVIPLLFGLLIELVVVVPFRVPLEQTPNLWLSQIWVLGVLYTKIVCAITMMCPDCALRRAIERVYRNGVRALDLGQILTELAAPAVAYLSVALSVPYVTAHALAPLFVASPRLRNTIARRIYPCVLIVSFSIIIIKLQIHQFSKLYEHIKNDKYLVGRRLVNYHHNKSTSSTVVSQPAAFPNN